MSARFECPRCQTVFTRDKGDDDAFVECPSCGALAMSAGEATGVDSDALARAVSSPHDIPTEMQQAGAGLSTLSPSQESQDQASAEAPSDDLDAPSEPSGARERPDPFAAAGGAGIFSALLDRPAEPAAEPPPVDEGFKAGKQVAASIDLGLDDDFKDFSLPSTSPGSPALSPQKKTAAAKPKPKPSEKSEKAPTTNPLLAPDPTAAPLSAAGLTSSALSDDTFGALEAAFDTMAAKPAPVRGKDGLSEADRAFLRSENSEKEPAFAAKIPPPPRRPPPRAAARPPARAARPLPLPKARDRSRGLTLSEEAKDAAFLRLREGSAPPRRLPPEMRGGDDAPLSATAEATVPQQLAPPREAGHGGPSSSSPEPTDIVETRRGKTRPPKRETPSVMRGLPAIALSVAVFVGLAGGAAVGALTAPQRVKRNDARARAEAQLAEGNRFYEQGRFDDALGRYKGAISIDRVFALAHRAKGAALAKQQRYDEAAEAYREYLSLESSAIDASDVKEALTHRGLSVDPPKSPDRGDKGGG